MMSLAYILWMYVFLFAIVGALRGWVKELIVSFSVILALALSYLLRKYVPVVSGMGDDSPDLFWIRSVILGFLVFFGYQTVALVPHLQSKAVRERVVDWLFGAVLGAVNGFLIAGSFLFYLALNNYQVAPNAIIPPTGAAADAMKQLLPILPPHWLGEPWIYFAVILSFIFVIVVYI
jgi:uncharacterized membrane protein required for colicin V production